MQANSFPHSSLIKNQSRDFTGRTKYEEIENMIQPKSDIFAAAKAS